MYYEIQNIVPFNDVYYVNCFCLSFFSAVKYLNGSIFSYIANDFFVYKLQRTLNGLSLTMEKKEVLSFSELGTYNGLNIECFYNYCSDIIDIIIDSILNGSIVLLPIDGFYYKHPYHDLFYLKEHHHNYILVYGFDSERGVFKTIEVNGFEWNTKKCCYKHEISFKDLIICHIGIINYVHKARPTLLKLSKDNSHKMINDNPFSYKDTLINNLKIHKDDIVKGLQNICILADNIEQFDISTSTSFNNKVSSMANQYKMKCILGDDGNYLPLLKDIVEIWKIIEALIYKNKFKGSYEKKKFYFKLNQLYKLESLLYEKLFESFETV